MLGADIIELKRARGGDIGLLISKPLISTLQDESLLHLSLPCSVHLTTDLSTSNTLLEPNRQTRLPSRRPFTTCPLRIVVQ